MGKKGKKTKKGAQPRRSVAAHKGASAEDLVEQAQTHMLFGNYDQALEIMRALHAACPGNTEVLDVSAARALPDALRSNKAFADLPRSLLYLDLRNHPR